MADKKYRGVEQRDELRHNQTRPDTRPMTVRAKAYFATTDGVILAMMVLPCIALLTIRVPMSGELLLLLSWVFYQLFVNPGHNDPKRKTSGGQIRGKHRVYDFPYRVPFSAKRFDGSYAQPKLGGGITFLGREISSKLEIWSADSDLRTHMLVLGTTGSGKTEFLLGLVYNALVQNSGFIYTDGKGAVDLYLNVFRLARYLGREDDLLVINFLTSGRDFLDKQLDRTTNTMNPFALGSSGMLIELIISLMDDSGSGGDMWKGRAIAFVAGLTRVLCYLRDRGYMLLDSNKFIEYFELPVVESVVWDKKISVDGKDITITDPLFDKVIEPLKAFVVTLPGYTKDKKGAQEQKTLEQHGFITMQLTRLFGDLSFTYGYIFQTLLGEVDMYDVVINRRILVVLLPSLERAPDSLKMLGKLIVGSIKQMMAGCLGNRLEGSVREIVDARPTNAAVPFYVVLDEYGYYAVLGFAVAPAQARSLGFPQPLRSRVKVGEGRYTTIGEIMPGDLVMLPNGGRARVKEVRLTGEMPVARVRTQSGKEVDAAFAHHWPVRVRDQLMVKTTLEIENYMKAGIEVELSVATAAGLVYEKVSSIVALGIEPTRCIVVEHDMHCYVTDGDIVTHNCITFAAQDFSSLQKASKEEADATWENTNVRIVGRITSGSESETWRRISGVGSDASIYEGGRKEHTPEAMLGGYRTNLDANVARAKRIEYDDLAEQENGEFTFLIGKKNSDGTGGVRVIRARTFYTAVKERPSRMRVNRFLKVEPPRSTGGADKEIEIIETLERVIGEALKKGDLKKVFPDDPVEMLKNKPPQLFKMSQYLREAQERAHLPLDQAIRVAFLCDEREAAVMAAAAADAPAPGDAVEVDTDNALARSAEALTRSAIEAAAAQTGTPVSVQGDAAGTDVAVLDEDLPSVVPMDGGVQPVAARSEAIDALADVIDEDLPTTVPLADDDEADGNASQGKSAGNDEFSTSFALDDDEPAPTHPTAPATDVRTVEMSFAAVDADDVEAQVRAARDGKKDDDAAKGSAGSGGAAGATGSSGGSGGGMGLALAPNPQVAEDDPATPVDAKAAVIDYLSSYEFDVKPLGEGDASGVEGEAGEGATDGTSKPKQVLSVLTLSTLGEDDEPSEISSYLADQISITETALGVKQDSLEIAAEARRTADNLEKITAYVDGPTPATPTLEEWDSAVEGLVDAADRNLPNYL